MVRTIEKLTVNGWVVYEFKELVEHDIFRLFDDGVLFVDKDGNSEFQTISDSYLNKEGFWQVDITG